MVVVVVYILYGKLNKHGKNMKMVHVRKLCFYMAIYD